MPLSAWGPGQWSPFSSWRYTHELLNSMIFFKNPAEAKVRGRFPYAWGTFLFKFI
jgi:hypothetical protein